MKFLYIFGGFAGANDSGKYCHLTTCKHDTYLKDQTSKQGLTPLSKGN